jgi:hypothetical protein
MDPLDELAFDCSTFTLLGDTPDARRWMTSTGDVLALHHCPFRPAIQGSQSLEIVRAYYRKLAEPKAGLVEVETRALERNVTAIRTIVKAAQQPSGRMYVGALTLPFRDFSYVLEVRCDERGCTGTREAEIVDRLLKAREVVADDATGELRGWADDPYDHRCRAPLVRNRSERAEYDGQFADHPLSRTRRTLDLLERTLRVSARICCARRPHAYLPTTIARYKS